MPLGGDNAKGKSTSKHWKNYLFFMNATPGGDTGPTKPHSSLRVTMQGAGEFGQQVDDEEGCQQGQEGGQVADDAPTL